MADLLEMAKQLGKELQKDERYLAFRKASADNDADEALQNLIGEFNLKRLDLGNELSSHAAALGIYYQYVHLSPSYPSLLCQQAERFRLQPSYQGVR